MAKRKNPAAVALGRLGGLASGQVRTAEKSATSRRNGKKGGRPVGAKDKRPRKRRSEKFPAER